MKAISIKQPWAWLIAEGIKDIENRTWKTDYRGKLIVHASKRWDQEGYEFIRHVMRERVPGKSYHHYGMLLGVVEMVDCVEDHPSKWFGGPYGFVFTAPEIWQEPIPYRGRLRLFEVPSRILRDIPIK